MDNASWSIEGVPGAFAAWTSDLVRGEAIGEVTVASFVLGSCRSQGMTVPILRWTLPVPPSDAPDEDIELLLDRHAGEYVAERTLHESSIRNALRRAFRADRDLRDMLRTVFREAPDWFMEDWFDTHALGTVAA